MQPLIDSLPAVGKSLGRGREGECFESNGLALKVCRRPHRQYRRKNLNKLFSWMQLNPHPNVAPLYDFRCFPDGTHWYLTDQLDKLDVEEARGFRTVEQNYKTEPRYQPYGEIGRRRLEFIHGINQYPLQHTDLLARNVMKKDSVWKLIDLSSFRFVET